MNRPQVQIGVNMFVVTNNTLLLGKRKNTVGDGDWGLPGGHLEFMESLEAGAKRELEEETGLKARNVSFLHVINDPRQKDNSHYIHVDFLAEQHEGELVVAEPDKCYEWKWFDYDALPDNIFTGHRRSISAFLSKSSFFCR